MNTNYDIPDRNLEPPDPPLPEELKCVICEVLADPDDFIQVHGEAVCIWCADKVIEIRARGKYVPIFQPLKWFAYLHNNGTIQVKRMFNRVSWEDAKSSPFVQKVTEIFEAGNREEAIQKASELLS